MKCDKCGCDVPKSNDAVWIQSYATEQPISLLVFGSRCFLPTDTCPGSPSRAQYIAGQPRDSRYPYDKSMEKKWRMAYKRILKICAAPAEEPA